MEVNPMKSNFCFWDKHEFKGDKIMCPISYKPKQIVRKKREYQLNYGISRYSPLPENIYKVFNFYIEYEDCFCSKECCLSWIDENSSNIKYSLSKQIFLHENYSPDEIPRKAPHWRLLKDFGGFLSIEEFRKNKTYTNYSAKIENNCVIKIYKEVNTCI